MYGMNGNFFNIRSCGQLATYLWECSFAFSLWSLSLKGQPGYLPPLESCMTVVNLSCPGVISLRQVQCNKIQYKATLSISITNIKPHVNCQTMLQWLWNCFLTFLHSYILTVCKRNYFTRLIPYFTISKFFNSSTWTTVCSIFCMNAR